MRNEYYDEEEWTERVDMFEDPSGNSALRRSSKTNPRDRTCPTCKEPNKLTPSDVFLGYQCNQCADRDEGGY